MRYILLEALTDSDIDNLFVSLPQSVVAEMNKLNNVTAATVRTDDFSMSDWKQWKTGWTEVASRLSGKDLDDLTTIFIYKWFSDNNIPIETVEQGLDVLIKLINELGYEEAKNPYLEFFKKVFKIHPDLELTRQNLIFLNDVYSDEALGVEPQDLRGSGQDKTNYILFNNDLYKKELNEALGIVKNYNWLSNINNIKQLKFEPLKKEDAKGTNWQNASINQRVVLKDRATTNEMTDLINNGQVEDVRNMIIFKNPQKPQFSELYTLRVIEDIITYATEATRAQSPDQRTVGKGISEEGLRQALKDFSKAYTDPSKAAESILKLLSDAGFNVGELVTAGLAYTRR